MKDIIPKQKKEFRIPGSEKAMNAVRRFSATEKVLFTLLIAIFSVSVFVMVWNVNSTFLEPIPAPGGSLHEGVIGSPRFINPILALNDVDRDLTSLIYSGLLRVDDGKLVPDLAEDYSISEDGLVYTFTLRDDIYFHDNTPVTAEDVLFTIQKAQDNILKSPRRANWDGVTVEVINAEEIRFTLKKPYAPFLENTTLGILPKHIWKNVDIEQFTFSQFNIEPIGSGPYKLKSIHRDSGGLPQSYELVPFKKYTEGEPYIDLLVLHFYPNENMLVESYNKGIIESISSMTPSEAVKINSPDTHIVQAPLPRVFGVFINQNQAPVLAHKEVREALNTSLNRERIVDEVLNGYGTAITSPIAPGILNSPEEHATELMSNASTTESNPEKEAAIGILTKAGWTLNENGVMEKKAKNKDTEILAFSISTSNAPELKRAAEIIKEEWAEIGADVTVRIFETGDLNQNVIRPRKYDTLLFGEIIGRDLDLYAFWHSSQRNDPGLNIAMYVNSKVDKLLEDARTIANKEDRIEKYEEIVAAINADIPALFVYSPDFIYALPKKVRGITLDHITTPADRFNDVHNWYINTDRVWKIFVKN